MLYRAIGLMSGSSLDGLDIVFAEFLEEGGNWSFGIGAAACFPYNETWKERLQEATRMSAAEYQQLHADYGHYLGTEVNRFIEMYGLQYKVGLVSSHGHTTFHVPSRRMTAQLGDGAALASETGLPVVTDLRAIDVAFGGQGAPIVPIGEKLLLKEYALLLNLGGIANISVRKDEGYIAYDICPANRVLNLLAAKEGREFDEEGRLASGGKLHQDLLDKLNGLPYYSQPWPKSLDNSFGNEEVFPLVLSFNLPVKDALRTYAEHIAEQVSKAVKSAQVTTPANLLVTGGGAFNTFVVNLIREKLQTQGVEVTVPSEELVQYKEALIMALMGVLRWRQEYNVLSSVTGASRDSIGGALWIGQEA